jgi:hypothetical protein
MLNHSTAAVWQQNTYCNNGVVAGKNHLDHMLNPCTLALQQDG